MARQLELGGVDTRARPDGRSERGPTARRAWRELRWLTQTMLEGEHGQAVAWGAWYELYRRGRARRWWTLTDVDCLLRPYAQRGLLVPKALRLERR